MTGERLFTYTSLMKTNHVGFAAPVEEELADTVTIGEFLIRHKESTYLLEVESDSMKEEGIRQGDMILFERRMDAKPGDIVVALTADGYTLKYLKKNKEEHIIGVVTATFRTYI